MLFQQMNNSKNVNLIDSYQIIKELGYGSFSKVYMVRRKNDRKVLAMKKIHMDRISQKQKQAAFNQIRILSSITSPYVIGYEQSFHSNSDQTFCMIMEYADGGDLQYKIRQRKQFAKPVGFHEKFIWKVAFEILCGLRDLHQYNIIHRDLKCANIFFVKNVAKLGDMNISKITDGLCSTKTGTPYYTSPEIWKGEKYDLKCDIWALGCVVYEMATLNPPFMAQDFPSLEEKVLQGKYTPLSSQYSNQLSLFIRRCLQLKAENRPTARELLDLGCFDRFSKSFKDIKVKCQSNLVNPILFPLSKDQKNQDLDLQLPNRKLKKKTVLFCKEELDTPQNCHFSSIHNQTLRTEKSIGQKCSSKTQIKSLKSFINLKSAKKLPDIIEKSGSCAISRQTSMKKIQTKPHPPCNKTNFKIRRNINPIKVIKHQSDHNNKENLRP